MIKIFSTFIALLLLSGCSGKIYTILNPELPRDNEKMKIQGVLVYNSIKGVKSPLDLCLGGNEGASLFLTIRKEIK